MEIMWAFEAFVRGSNPLSCTEKGEDMLTLEEQIEKLAQVLLYEFDGPKQSESVCEMAIRVLRKQKKLIDEYESEQYRQYTETILYS